LLVQTVGELEDSYDWEGIMNAGARHKANFGRLREALEKEHPSVFAMGAGACMLCESCTYPDAPCRFPDKMSASMEACGLFVSKVCTDNNLKYNYGRDKIAFTSCFLLK
jgi:predicted metal-binding protein